MNPPLSFREETDSKAIAEGKTATSQRWVHGLRRQATLGPTPAESLDAITPCEAVQKGRDRKTLVLNLVMPDFDPASPACFRDSRSRIPQRYYKKEDALDLLFLKSL